jgi:polyhydroxyalkanoate synthesis regulator phasin
MDTGKMTKQMLDFHKATFDNTFNAMVMLQDQTEKMVNTFIAQATWLPEEGRKVVNEWLSAYKKGREDFKKVVDDNFKKVEDFFATTGKAEKETKKQTKAA